jgi:hypothetical protein
MDTLFWGPGLWMALHSMTFNYPITPTEQDKKQYTNFFHSLKYVLPCPACRMHYKKTIEEKYPIELALDNRDTLSRWLVDFHNDVNKRLGKPIVSYDSVKDKYESMRGKCQYQEPSPGYTKTRERKTDLMLSCVIILLILITCLSIYYFPKLKQRHNRL